MEKHEYNFAFEFRVSLAYGTWLNNLLIDFIRQRFAESLRKPVRTYRRSSTQELVVEEIEEEVTAR